MTTLAILEYPDPRLRIKAVPVQVYDGALRRLVDDMFETMYEAKGIGLAATQVNVHQRLLVLDVSEDRDTPKVFINPQILEAKSLGPRQEGCLSVPGIYEKLTRASEIRVRAYDIKGRVFEMDAAGLLAVCIQHEIDHLDGKLFVDYLSELKRQLIRRRLLKEQRQRNASARTSAVS